jgi:hypothetical protein
MMHITYRRYHLVESLLGLLYYVDVGDVAHVLEVHVASIFRVRVRRLASFCIYMHMFHKGLGEPEL